MDLVHEREGFNHTVVTHDCEAQLVDCDTQIVDLLVGEPDPACVVRRRHPGETEELRRALNGEDDLARLHLGGSIGWWWAPRRRVAVPATPLRRCAPAGRVD